MNKKFQHHAFPLRRWPSVFSAVFGMTLNTQIAAQTETSPGVTPFSISWQVPLIIVLAVISMALSLFIALYAWQRRSKPGVLAFSGYMLAVAESSIASSLAIFSRTAGAAMFWTNLIFLGTAFLPAFLLIFLLQYGGWGRWLSQRRIGLLLIIPVLTQVMAWTNAWHHLFIREVHFELQGAFMLATNKQIGPLFGVHMAYSNLLMLMTIICIVAMIIRPFHLYRKQAISLLLAMFPPVLNGILIAFDVFPTLQNQLTPFALTLMGSIYAWTLFRHRFLDVVPVARGTLIDNMSDGMLVLDNEDRIIDLNPALHRLLGDLSSQYVGKSAFEVLRPWPDLEELVRQATPVQTDITLNSQKPCQHYHVQISLLTDKRGRPTGKLIFLQDITGRKQAEAQLLAAHAELQEKNVQLHELNASKDKFFSIISHDLRGSFSTLLGLSQMLEHHLSAYTPTEIQERVHWLHTSAERLYALLENLLTWSRLQRGVMQQQIEPVRVVDIVEDNIALFETAAQEKQIVLSHAVPDTLWAYADHSMVNTVIHNLVSNALKFTPAGGRIEVSGQKQGELVEIAVADTGVGIYPGDISKLFRIDTHYTNPGTGGERGTGLGLILCQELVERNNGKIWVESVVGQGTTFKITLPRSETPKHELN